MIDGLASVFTGSTTAALQAVLEALKTRRHIAVVNVHDTYHAMKEREAAQRRAEGRKSAIAQAQVVLSCCAEGGGVPSVASVT